MIKQIGLIALAIGIGAILFPATHIAAFLAAPTLGATPSQVGHDLIVKPGFLFGLAGHVGPNQIGNEPLTMHPHPPCLYCGEHGTIPIGPSPVIGIK